MAKIINLSESVLIALHSLILMTQKRPDFMNSKEIAGEIMSSENTIAKVMQRLSKAQLIRSYRGPAGGFTLAKEPGEITLLQVYEIMEGNIEGDTCPFNCSSCIFGRCIFGDFIDNMTREFKEKLKNLTLAAYI